MNIINVKSCNISQKTINQEETLKVDIKFTLTQQIQNASKIWAELSYIGEAVAKDIHTFESICEDSSYTENFEITPPFNAPDGIYELRLCFESESQNINEYEILGEVQVGEPVVDAIPYKATIYNVVIPKTIKKDESFEVFANIKTEPGIDFETTPYITVWKDQLLYDVIEGEVSVANDIKSIAFSSKITADMPDGVYSVRIGLHNINCDDSKEIYLSVTGADTIKAKYHKPLSHGNYYVKSTGKEHFWYINQSGAVIWDGKPYFPFGGMFVPKYLRQYDENNPEVNKKFFQQDKADLDELRAAGINDLYIGANIIRFKPNWIYKYFLDYLEKTGWKYGIQGDTIQKREGSAFYPYATSASKRFKVENVKESGKITLAVPTSFADSIIYEKNAVYIVVDNRTNEMIASGISAMSKNSDGEIIMSADVKIPEGSECTVYFTPEVYQDFETAPNFWDEPEATYNRIDDVFSRLKPGENFRFVVDLHNNECGLYGPVERARFSDEAFNKLYANFLENKYKTVYNINSAWKTSPAISSFSEASELIPVFTSDADDNNNSFTYYVNMITGAGYKVDTRNGFSWNDYLDAREQMYLDFMNKSSDIVKKHYNVPQIFKHVSIQRNYFINKNTVGGFDGMGAEAYGDIEATENKFTLATLHNDQFARTAWNLVTETNNLENVMGKYKSHQWSYVSKEDMFHRFNSAINLGMKGIFDFLLADRPDIEGRLGMAYSWIINKHVIGWASEYKNKYLQPAALKEIVKQKYMTDIFYYYPANKAWWIHPNERSVVQLVDDNYPFKRLKTENGIHVLSTDSLDINTKLIFINLNNAPYSKIFGPKISEYLIDGDCDKRFCVLGHRNDLGAIPEIDKYYTEEKVVINNNGETVQILKPTKTSEVLKTTKDGKPWALKDGNLYIIATDSFETSVEELGTLHYVDDLGVTDFDC